MTAVMHDSHAEPQIGPNAILQLLAALGARFGEAARKDLLERAGLARYLATPPEAMIPQAEVIAAYESLVSCYPFEQAEALAAEAGARTADYLLAKRIPKAVQWLLKLLPAPLAARVLFGAIGAHAWTFAGSARFSYAFLSGRAGAGGGVAFSLQGCVLGGGPPDAWPNSSKPVLAEFPMCVFYHATFSRLGWTLISPKVCVLETACVSDGAPACEFLLSWP